ncbi:hypothetical protein PhaeoP97_02415 [Phaeobacter porticola]|uniref:Uncharacterized protein n=1 Tax=Phaeobacter porticola TaxID=1844006 RepID=A0A1L3I6U6_9RHOB|nr:hypothetical protein PhaeoP97_02415 [Phaeobacter porticola]
MIWGVGLWICQGCLWVSGFLVGLLGGLSGVWVEYGSVLLTLLSCKYLYLLCFMFLFSKTSLFHHFGIAALCNSP